jgi:hypothetical protein
MTPKLEAGFSSVRCETIRNYGGLSRDTYSRMHGGDKFCETACYDRHDLRLGEGKFRKIIGFSMRDPAIGGSILGTRNTVFYQCPVGRRERRIVKEIEGGK